MVHHSGRVVAIRPSYQHIRPMRWLRAESLINVRMGLNMVPQPDTIVEKKSDFFVGVESHFELLSRF